MLTTTQLLDAFRAAYPRQDITEDRLRRAIRLGRAPRPRLHAGRYVWTEADVAKLAAAFGLDDGTTPPGDHDDAGTPAPTSDREGA